MCWTSTSPSPALGEHLCRGQPNKTHLFTRHFSALHTVLQPIKDRAEGIRRQLQLPRRHQLHHRPVRLFHSGGSRHGNQQTPTGEEQQRRTPHVWILQRWNVKAVVERLRHSGFFCTSIELQSSARRLNHRQCTWALLADWLRGELWSTCLSVQHVSAAAAQQHAPFLLITHKGSTTISNNNSDNKQLIIFNNHWQK